MLRVEHLLSRNEVAPRVVERARHDALVAISSHSAHGQRPTVFAQTGGVSEHTAKIIVAIGVSHAGTSARSIVLGKGDNVVGAAHIAKAVAGGFESHADALVLERLVHAAHHRVVEAAASRVVEHNAVNHRLGVLAVVATHTKTHKAKVVAGSLIEDVVVSAAQGCNRLTVALLIFDLRFTNDEIVGIVRAVGYANQLDGANIFHHICRNYHILHPIFVAVAKHQQAVVASHCVRDAKIAIRPTRDRYALLVEHHRCSHNRQSRLSINHRASHPRALCKRR